MGWADYGFPDVTMLSSYLPAKGIELAMAERGMGLSAVASPWTETISKMEKFGLTTPYYGDRIYAWKYPYMYWTPPDHSSYRGTYSWANHLIDYSTHPEQCRWTEDAMAEAIASRDVLGECILNASDYTMTPWYSVDYTMTPWHSVNRARQRYINLNLFKEKVYPVIFTMKTWSTSNWHASPAEAWNAAIEEGAKDPSDSDKSLLAFRAGIEYYDYLGYKATMLQPVKIEIDYTDNTELYGLPAYLYLMAQMSTSIWHVFDSFGIGNIAPTGYSKISLPYEATIPLFPITDDFQYNRQYGFNAYHHTGGVSGGYVNDIVGSVDVSSLFEFYDNVD